VVRAISTSGRFEMGVIRPGSQGTLLDGFTTPKSLPEFQRVFPDDDACAAYLYASRFPTGFICPYCHVQCEPYRFKNYPGSGVGSASETRG